MMKAKKVMNQIEARDTRPLYLHIADLIRDFIANNDLKSGDRLPSVEQLAADFSVSRITVREALSYLESHNVLLRKHGVGTFITKAEDSGLSGGLEKLTPFRVLAERAGKTSRVIENQTGFSPAPRKIADFLGIAEGDQVIQVLTLEAVENNPCMLSRDYIQGDMETLGKLDGLGCSIIDYLRRSQAGAHIRARSELSAVEADGTSAQMLAIKPGRPLLRFHTAYFSLEGDLLAAGITDFLTDFFQFHIMRSTDDLK
jgi:GntR family transcriptional regulator